MAKQTPPTWVKKVLSTITSGKFVASCAGLLLAIGFAGCSDMGSSPTMPSLNDNLGTSSIDLISGKTKGPEWTVQEMMYRHGGTIYLDGGQLYCTFSREALPVNQALITASMKLNAPRGQATRLDIDFQPSMTFEKSVTITIDATYLSGTGNTYTLWYFDPILHKWLKQATNVFTPSQPTTFNLYHYSAYALTR
jgi:hypothetical protein